MLRTVGSAIKGADPGTEVIAAAISESKLGMPLQDFFQGMYNAGAKGAFDTLAVHPYAAAADQVYAIMLKDRRIADRNGDSGTPLRVTEVGWATSGPQSPFRVDPTAQAELVKRVWAAGLLRPAHRARGARRPTQAECRCLHPGGPGDDRSLRANPGPAEPRYPRWRTSRRRGFPLPSPTAND